MILYAMSDIHGCLQAFDAALELVDLSGDNKLVLCGDYIHGGGDDYGVLDRIMSLEQTYGSDKIIVLAGNHEDMACDGRWQIGEEDSYETGMDNNHKDERYIMWMKKLRRYYVEGNTIFVHAGIEEEAEDLWEWATDEYTLTEKYPAQLGKFICGNEDMTIIAGHVGTAVIAQDSTFHDIFFDGKSHYYIDGTVLDSGRILVMKVDTDKKMYYRVTETGEWFILSYAEIRGKDRRNTGLRGSSQCCNQGHVFSI